MCTHPRRPARHWLCGFVTFTHSHGRRVRLSAARTRTRAAHRRSTGADTRPVPDRVRPSPRRWRRGGCCMNPKRSALCVPASESDRILKALASDADEVVIDLEDAVPTSRKNLARANIQMVMTRRRGSIAVRINAPGSEWFDEDLSAAAGNPSVESIVVPKAESADQIARIATQLDYLERGGSRRTLLRLQALIESARGLADVQAIASSPRVDALIIGYADLGASL